MRRTSSPVLLRLMGKPSMVGATVTRRVRPWLSTASVSYSFPWVAASAQPESFSLLFFWKAATALAVFSPYLPSALPDR